MAARCIPSLHLRGWNWRSFQVPSKPNHSTSISVKVQSISGTGAQPLRVHHLKKKEFKTSIMYSRESMLLPLYVCGKAALRRSPKCPSTSSPTAVTATPSRTSPELHQEYFKGATIPFYLHPREDSQSELKDNIPQVCLVKGHPDLTSTTCEHQSASNTNQGEAATCSWRL